MKIDTRYSLAVIALTLLGSGCANQPQQAGQAPVVQSTVVAATAPATPVAAKNDDPLECEYVVPTGSMIRKWFCLTASDKAWLEQRGMASDYHRSGVWTSISF
jgi:hypothetical protein